MEKVTKYRQLIKKILEDYEAMANRSRRTEGMETHAVFDETRDRYMVFETGWWVKKRVRSITLYVRLANSKFWIEEDWTKNGITTELLQIGVPKEDIVLAFHPPEMRQHTEFAIA